MVNFIKENLLGSIKEFRNRFINPIQNGQCADSTLVDVRVMKKRAHILYEMLAGCVQVCGFWFVLLCSIVKIKNSLHLKMKLKDFRLLIRCSPVNWSCIFLLTSNPLLLINKKENILKALICPQPFDYFSFILKCKPHQARALRVACNYWIISKEDNFGQNF